MQFPEHLMRITADVADRNAAVFHLLMHEFHHVLAPVFRQLRDGETNNGAIVGGIEPKVGLLDRLFDRFKRSFIVRLNRQQARIRHAHARELLEGRRCAVVIDAQLLNEAGAGAAGTNSREVSAQRVDRLAHAFVRVFQRLSDHRVVGHRQTPAITVSALQT